MKSEQDISIDNNVGFAVSFVVWMGVGCHRPVDNTKVLVHTMHHGVLCHILCYPRVFGGASEGCVLCFVGVDYRDEFLHP